MTTIAHNCLVCGKEKKDDGSKLSYCSKCKVANYCSVDCQRSDWKKHKKWCPLTNDIPIGSTAIYADCMNEKYLDMNLVLDYLGNYVVSLKHLYIGINERVINYWGSHFIMGAPALKKFLESTTSQTLLSFGLLLEHRHAHVNSAITNGGLALLPIAHQPSLKTLLLSCLHFDRVSDFCTMLSGHRQAGQTLRQLEIKDLSFGTNHVRSGAPSIWSLADAKAIANAIQELESLERLSLGKLEDECLQGRDASVLSVLLTNKPNLRYLGIDALENWELKMFGRSSKGTVTDQNIEMIVKQIGSTVQELQFTNQTQITTVGLETILKGCPLLRKLVITGSYFTVEELARLLPCSKTLLSFEFGDVSGMPPTYGNLEFGSLYLPAIIASEGRVIINCRYEARVDESKLPPSFAANRKYSEEMIKQHDQKYKDLESDATNFWDFLL
jgi:hypothetical protein